MKKRALSLALAAAMAVSLAGCGSSSSGAEGWNCIKTDTIIFYSQNYSYKIMKQSAGRIDRLNTPFKDLYYYHLKSRSGIDLGISRSLKDKKDFNETKFVKWSGNTPSKTAA